MTASAARKTKRLTIINPMKRILSTLLISIAFFTSCERQSVTGANEPGSESSAPQVVGCPLDGIRNVHQLDDIYLAGQPSEEGLQTAKAEDIRTVVSLRHANEMTDFDEPKAVEEAGLTYVHLPWNGEGELTDNVFQKARELFAWAERPMLMHCGSANRVGALWVPWRVLGGNIGLEDVMAEAKIIGLKSTAYEQKAREYISRTQPTP